MANMTRNFTSASDMVNTTVTTSLKGALVGSALQIAFNTAVYFCDPSTHTGNFKRTMRYYVEDCLVPIAKGCLIGTVIGTGIGLTVNSAAYITGANKQ